MLLITTLCGLHSDSVEGLETTLNTAFKLRLLIVLNLIELIRHHLTMASTCGKSLELALSLRRELLLSNAVGPLTAVC